MSFQSGLIIGWLAGLLFAIALFWLNARRTLRCNSSRDFEKRGRVRCQLPTGHAEVHQFTQGESWFSWRNDL